MNQAPQMFKWGYPRLNNQNPQKRFLNIEWNNLLIDQKTGFHTDYMYAEQGQEFLGDDELVEILHPIKNNLLVQGEDRDGAAGPSDTVVIYKNVVTKLWVNDPTLVFFICFAQSNPLVYLYMLNLLRNFAEKLKVDTILQRRYIYAK